MGKPLIEKAFKFFGENPNGAIIVAVSIAAFKGVFRPIFTLTDKKSDPKTKKYTAIREALTELIAIPVYIAVPTIGGKIVAKKLASSPAVTRKAAEANVKFLGVLASTAIIPAVCNVIQPPIMNALQKKSEAKKEVGQVNNITKPGKTTFKGAYPMQIKKTYSNNIGMRVGN